MMTSEAVCLAVHHHVLTQRSLACPVVEIGIYCETVVIIFSLKAWWDWLRIDMEWCWLINFDRISSPALENTSVGVKFGSLKIGRRRTICVEESIDLIEVLSFGSGIHQTATKLCGLSPTTFHHSFIYLLSPFFPTIFAWTLELPSYSLFS